MEQQFRYLAIATNDSSLNQEVGGIESAYVTEELRALGNHLILQKSSSGMKNAVFWDVMPCGSCMNRRFGGT
jgi:hypothetical protein